MTGPVTVQAPRVPEDRTGIRWMVRLAEAAQPRFGESRLDLLVWEVVPYMADRTGRRVFGQARKQFPYRALPAAHRTAMAYAAEHKARSGP